MRILIQRVLQASVTIENRIHSEIKKGLLIFIGIHKEDRRDQASWLAEKATHLRLFTDSEDKMNLSVQDVHGEILIISQFTLYGDCMEGRRPEFTQAAKGLEAKALYTFFVDEVRKLHKETKTGVFGADMKVQLLNDGPVTFFIEK
jgi:D-tyrosyl-tRNA(Tyr) deacylase